MSLTWPLDSDSVDSALRLAVSWWNGLGLPLLLVVLAFRLAKRDIKTWADRRKTIRVVGLIHYALALWSVTTVASALWVSRGMEAVAAQVFLSEVAPAIPIAFNVLIGLGLRRLARWAWVGALLLGMIRAAFTGWLLGMALQFGGSFDLTEWPTLVSSRLLPVVVLGILVLPGTWRALKRNAEDEGTPGKIDVVAALFARGMLIVLASAVLTDAIDTVVRALTGTT